MVKFMNSELKVFEKLFIIDGYVLDFNNNDFGQFILNVTGIDVYKEDYLHNVSEVMGGSSKGKILKYFLHNESYSSVVKLLNELVEYYEVYEDSSELDIKQLTYAKKILEKHSSIDYLIDGGKTEERIDNLINDINQSIIRGEPEFTLDRLHTLMVSYIKELCDNHGIDYEEKSKLNQLFRKYSNIINEDLESDLSKTILVQTGSIFDKFNEVRNNKSYAHDNDILNRAESLLIYRNIVNIYEFIKTIEKDVL